VDLARHLQWFFQDLPLQVELLVLTSELPQLVALRVGQPIGSEPLVGVGMGWPPPDRVRGRLELPPQLFQAPACPAVQGDAFFGYTQTVMAAGQECLVADAPKALLDLVYLTPGGDAQEYLASLRLEGLGAIPEGAFRAHSQRWGKPKLRRAVDRLLAMGDGE
jgi:hypothetical protein